MLFFKKRRLCTKKKRLFIFLFSFFLKKEKGIQTLVKRHEDKLSSEEGIQPSKNYEALPSKNYEEETQTLVRGRDTKPRKTTRINSRQKIRG